MIIVADLLPLFDRSSGGLRLKTIIDMMGEAGWTMVFGSHAGLDSQPGILNSQTGRSRYEEALRRSGVTRVLYGAGEIEKHIGAAGPKITLAFLSTPYVAKCFIHIFRSLCPGTRVIYDMVDFHSVRIAREAATTNNPNLDNLSEKYRVLETECAAAADITLAVTEEEKTYLQGLVPGAVVRVLPNVFEVPSQGPGPIDRTGLLFVGNFWHRPNSDAARWFVSTILPGLRREIPDIVFRIAGANPGSEVLELALEPGVEVLGFVEDLAPLFKSHRLFVAPLRYGAGMKGKVGQSLIHGLPVVSTPVGAEGMGLIDGVHLLTAGDAQSFTAQVIRLLRDDELWESLSTAGREHIRARYSIEAVRDKLGAVLGYE